MSKLRNFILAPVNEAAYAGNIGFEEMVRFYQKASDSDIEKMEKIIKDDDWDGFRAMIKKVLHVDLKK